MADLNYLIRYMDRQLEKLEDLPRDRSAYYDWAEETQEHLEEHLDYQSCPELIGIPRRTRKLSTVEERLRDTLNETYNDLLSVPERFGLESNINSRDHEWEGDESSVFIVHGHDDGAKHAVARCITQLGLHPIILHEQANQGKTIIEKFEAHASSVRFAVILFTQDDLGRAKSESKLQARARQNVILELGYFIGKLGRERVAVLYKQGVEIPSDLLGIVYMPMHGEWQLKIAKEMREAGLDVDMNYL